MIHPPQHQQFRHEGFLFIILHHFHQIALMLLWPFVYIYSINGRYSLLIHHQVFHTMLMLSWSITFIRTQLWLTLPHRLQCRQRSLECVYKNLSQFPLLTQHSTHSFRTPNCWATAEFHFIRLFISSFPSFNGGSAFPSMAPSATTPHSLLALASDPVETHADLSFSPLPLCNDALSAVSSSFCLSLQSSSLLVLNWPLPWTRTSYSPTTCQCCLCLCSRHDSIVSTRSIGQPTASSIPSLHWRLLSEYGHHRWAGL